MKKVATAKFILAIAFSVIFNAFSFASNSHPEAREINIAGLIVNAETLSPIESATIYDGGNHLLGTTDKNGYFKVTINYNKPGEIYFRLRIAKQGFQQFTQREHWGNLGSTGSIMYFGLHASGSAARAFSSMPNNTINSGDMSYDNVLRNFDKVKEERSFNDKLTRAKAGNEDVFVRIDNTPYIVNNSGWIKLNTENDLISIDDKKTIAANKLNTTIKRKTIKRMTPLEGKEAMFGVYTR